MGQALHTYFRVSDYGERDRPRRGGLPLPGQGGRRREVAGPAARLLRGKTDRVYLESVRDCVIEDPGLRARHPDRQAEQPLDRGVEPGARRGGPADDFGPSGSREMLCVETANAAADVVRLEPHAVHLLFTRYSVGPVG